jgi:hypothetical protein
MNIRHRLGGHLCRGGALIATLALASPAVVLASNAAKGKSYVGSYAGVQSGEISFEVSANGKQVIDLSVSTPFKCSGGCGGVVSPSGGTAQISRQGTFKATLKLHAPGTGKVYGSDTVTGKFLTHGEATGTVTSHFDAGASSDRKVVWSAVD